MDPESSKVFNEGSPLENSTKIDLDVVDSEDEETFLYTEEELRALADECPEIELPAYYYQFNYEGTIGVQTKAEKRKDAENAEEDAMDMQPKAKKMRGTSFGKSEEEQLEEKETGGTSFGKSAGEQLKDKKKRVETPEEIAKRRAEEKLLFTNVIGIPPDELLPYEDYIYDVDIVTAMLRYVLYCATSRRSPRYRRRTSNGR